MAAAAKGKGRTAGAGGPRKPPSAREAKDKLADGPAAYTAVIYVHGIGSQRRYEETSRLIDRLSQYVRRRKPGGPGSEMETPEARVEPLRSDPESEIIGYIRTAYWTQKGRTDKRNARFYEIYWAPVMAQAESARRVLAWLFRQPLRPWSTLRAPWRERQRLRRATLTSIFEPGRTPPGGSQPGDYDKLLRLYYEFENSNVQERYPVGSFQAFLEFVAEEEPADAARLEQVARRWRRAYVGEELRNAFVLTTMALALLLLGGGAVAAALGGLQALLDVSPFMGGLAGSPFKADLPTAAAVVVFGFGFLGLGKVLTDYLGDVEAWATYEETDLKFAARKKVLDESRKVLAHVLCDPACERVAIVAHSLGTSIAHDALLALRRHNQAHHPSNPMIGPTPMDKLEHFVTMGSPIDKIEYFFESYSSQHHRFKRVTERLRGDIGYPPFCKTGKPHVHWINFWDEGDVISGALHSPTPALPPRDPEHRQRVDNVHVASYRFPAPGASHAGYFDNEPVISTIFDVIFNRAASFRNLPLPPPDPASGQQRGYDYQSVYLNRSEPDGGRRIYQAMAVAIPWLALAGLVAWLAGRWTAADLRIAVWAAWGLGLAFLAILIAAHLASRAEGPLKPVAPRRA